MSLLETMTSSIHKLRRIKIKSVKNRSENWWFLIQPEQVDYLPFSEYGYRTGGFSLRKEIGT